MSRTNILLSQAHWYELLSRLRDFGFYVDNEVEYSEIGDEIVIHGWVEYQVIDEDEFKDMINDLS